MVFSECPNYRDISENMSNTKNTKIIELEIRKFCGSFQKISVRTYKLNEVEIQSTKPFNQFSRQSHWTVYKLRKSDFLLASILDLSNFKNDQIGWRKIP